MNEGLGELKCRRHFVQKNGFEHIQGSGYHTLMPMSEPDVMTIVYRMTRRFPWINYCVSVCTLADVPEVFDISHVFVREAERLDEAMTSTTQGMEYETESAELIERLAE